MMVKLFYFMMFLVYWNDMFIFGFGLTMNATFVCSSSRIKILKAYLKHFAEEGGGECSSQGCLELKK